jgi:GNAT superfamily N-acetyltransferase
MAGLMTASFRPATLDDSAFAAKVVAAIDPHPETAEEVRQRWIDTEKTCDVRRFLVAFDGKDTGWLSLVRPHDEDPGAVYLNVLLPSEAPAAAVDDAIAFGEVQGRSMAARRLVFNAWASRTAIIAALKARGWTEERRQRYWRLELQPQAERLRTQREEARARIAEVGVSLHTVAELGGDVVYPRIYEVAHATYGDIPSSVEYVGSSYDSWLVWATRPGVRLDRVWVASEGGRLVGLSFLEFQESLVHTGYTGVLREHRGKGIARALKLETLVQAADLGVEAVETDNDFENAPILHLNADLGYDEVMGQVQLHKQLD